MAKLPALATCLAVVLAAAALGAAERGRTVVQNGLDGYRGCALTPDADVVELRADKDPRELLVRFGDLHAQLRAERPRVLGARLELTFHYEWWTAYRHQLRCVDASPGGMLGADLWIYGERLGKELATREKSWVGWDLPPELVQRWIEQPATNRGVRIYFASSELLLADKGGDKEVGFLGGGRRNGLTRYGPRLILDYEGELRPESPAWTTDLAGRTLAGETILRWRTPGAEGTVIDIEFRTANRWVPLAEGLPAKAGEHVWNAGPFRDEQRAKLRIRSRVADRSSPWVESPEFRVAGDAEPFRLGALPTALKLRREPPLEYPADPVARIELARNEEEGVQLIIDRADRKLQDVTVTATELVSANGKRIPANDLLIRPVGYVFARNLGPYFTERDGWYADVLLTKTTFDVEPETIQPLWVLYRAGEDVPAGTYRGRITVDAKNVPTRSIPLEITVWDFSIPVHGRLSVLFGGALSTGVLGLGPDTPEAKRMEQEHRDLLIRHRITPLGLLNKFPWNQNTLPKRRDGSYDFTEFDADVEKLLANGTSRFVIALAPKPGKYGFPADYSDRWKEDMRAYLKLMCAHLKEKGWLDRAIFYGIDEAAETDWPKVKMLYQMVKEVEPKLRVMLSLNEPRGTKALAGHFDIINVNIRQYFKAGMPELGEKGKTRFWYVCCWPSENPNLFTEYPGIDPRVIGWMSWKFGLEGFLYWASAAWGNAFDNMDDKRCIDEILTKWNPNSFGRYNGDGCLVYPGPNHTLLRSTRLVNLRDGFEDYEYLAMLRALVDSGKLPADARAAAEKLLAVDDAVCDREFRYSLDGEAMLKARREIAKLLSTPPPPGVGALPAAP